MIALRWMRMVVATMAVITMAVITMAVFVPVIMIVAHGDFAFFAADAGAASGTSQFSLISASS